MKKLNFKYCWIFAVSLSLLLLNGCGSSETYNYSVQETKQETKPVVTEPEVSLETEPFEYETSEVTYAVSETEVKEISEARTEAPLAIETEKETAAETESPDEASTDDFNYTYWRQVASFAQNMDASHMMYQLYDIDFDGVPELIISTGEIHSSTCEIFAYKNGEFVDLGEYGSYGYVEFNTENGLMSYEYGNQGYLGNAYFKLTDSGFEKVITFYSDEGAVGSELAKYKINGEEVSEEEFRSRSKEYREGNIILLGRELITGL